MREAVRAIDIILFLLFCGLLSFLFSSCSEYVVESGSKGSALDPRTKNKRPSSVAVATATCARTRGPDSQIARLQLWPVERELAKTNSDKKPCSNCPTLQVDSARTRQQRRGGGDVEQLQLPLFPTQLGEATQAIRFSFRNLVFCADASQRRRKRERL